MRAWLAAALPQLWLRRGWPAMLLWPLSLLYGAVTALRRALFRTGLLRSTRLPVPVIVVGNVVAGGSGKTPVVMALVRHLQAAGWQVGVVSRGYGRSTTDCREVQPGSLAAQVGDEPALIQRMCQVPVFVAARRVQAGLALLERHPQTQILVCDDGLQHLPLQRDVEVCVFDDRGLGNGWLLPAGPLREPWPRPADIVVHTGERPAFGGFRARRSLGAFAQRADGTRLALHSLADTPVLAVAGIARPERFFAMLRSAGVRHLVEMGLPDHHDFSSWQSPAGAPSTWLCTEKDAVKLWDRHPEAWAVPLELALDPGLLQDLDARLAAQVPSSPSHSHIPDGQQTP
ncbi:tetraacyldisaccharide 4'-kinase [Pseudorhodoferax sp. Leaf267]|uniref:tetraacyldisaccharide 4'-kinase n=1 Tax=Pseudorhodoferax sp. Leaf267 TaxID=1736316 RepID=UPI000700F235|nr:tetraacyldisaccharide 4'-kinase [Pseudorhodoferax sp. Leaf267]KQP20009.1 tetraacyldisaccharide 4'-kinase [Pseudorhodoferax sp. Leaf267]